MWGWFFISKILKSNNSVYGIDYSKRAILLAKIMSGCEHITQEDLTNINNIKNNSFDVITNIAVIEHIKPKFVKKVIDNFYNILRKDGLLIMAIPTDNLKLPKKHFQHFSINRIRNMLKDFEILNMYGCHRKSYIFKFICRIFSNPWIKIPIIYKLLNPIYDLFYKNCNLNKASIVVVICRKK